jgi:hypothetical protein
VHRVADHEALGERTAVMGAGSADGEERIAPAGEQHRLLADVAEEIPVLVQEPEQNALGKIGTGRG